MDAHTNTVIMGWFFFTKWHQGAHCSVVSTLQQSWVSPQKGRGIAEAAQPPSLCAETWGHSAPLTDPRPFPVLPAICFGSGL